ncbi:unnamed protein product [Ilex paraguariensis]|uniref:Uncharacterized protein n=1 Tax=Ilex paraguariensis TaxID=185542 RepID=A0ABC8QVV5_9AQUA
MVRLGFEYSSDGGEKRGGHNGWPGVWKRTVGYGGWGLEANSGGWGLEAVALWCWQERDKLRAEKSSNDDKIDQMNKHLHQLHIEHVELIVVAKVAHRVVEELRTRVKEPEEEIKRQRGLILEFVEEKRDAIKQLCFSLEHYKNGY